MDGQSQKDGWMQGSIYGISCLLHLFISHRQGMKRFVVFLLDLQLNDKVFVLIKLVFGC